MSTKDYLKGLAVTLIPYRKGSNADKEGEIAEVVTEKGNGDSRYWGGNEDETSLFVTTDSERMHVDFMGTEHEDVCRLLDCKPVLVRDRENGEYYYIIKYQLI
ncbi:MAG: hypothetical protein AUK63_2447 [bacterium P3]|jgi:hypothetical protein|nr:MAG: hypothetical protein F083_3115 [bacterium F083]KWW26980.1 MAG: hypothetical protein AUK63_2447 [bacterium P3]MBP5338062.1 hypothetical protein [Prevotella sp.]MBR2150814.1 hypothetical protein [Prevotella sp.]